MAVTETELVPRRMCSLVTKDAGEDPIGSVAVFDRLLVIEVPLPWPRAIRSAPRFPAEAESALQRADAAGVRYRLYGIVPDKRYTPDGLIRLMDVSRPAGAKSLSVFTKYDYLVPPGKVGDLVTALLLDADRQPEFAAWRQPSTHIRDVLVCTHGTRDRCCATFGYPIYNHLRRAFAADETGSSRVWRVSHIGGHRFAPTVLDLPDGRCWAHLDDEAVSRLVRREGAPPDLQRHYRGWAALPTMAEQVAEREAFAREGWRWAKRAVRGEIIHPADPATERTEVRLTYAGPDGAEPGYYDMVVEPSGVVTRGLGSCRDDDLSEHRSFHVSQMTKHELCRPRQRFAHATAAPE